MNKAWAYIIGIICVTTWNVFIIGGCAYLVFWKEHSAWLFLLAIILMSSCYKTPPKRAGLKMNYERILYAIGGLGFLAAYLIDGESFWRIEAQCVCLGLIIGGLCVTRIKESL